MSMEGSDGLSRSLKPVRAEFRQGIKQFSASSLASGVDIKRAKGLFAKGIGSEKTGLKQVSDSEKTAKDPAQASFRGKAYRGGKGISPPVRAGALQAGDCHRERAGRL